MTFIKLITQVSTPSRLNFSLPVLRCGQLCSSLLSLQSLMLSHTQVSGKHLSPSSHVNLLLWQTIEREKRLTQPNFSFSMYHILSLPIQIKLLKTD